MLTIMLAVGMSAFTNKAAAQFSGSDGKMTIKPAAEFENAGNLSDSSKSDLPSSNGSRDVIFSCDFEGDYTSWTTENNSTANTWHIYTGNSDVPAHSGTHFAANVKSETSNQARNAWLFSPGINLTLGEIYTIRFWVLMPGIQDWFGGEYDKLEVKIAQGNNSTAMNSGTSLYSNTYLWISTWTLVEQSFKATATGVFYLGFHSFTEAEKGDYIAIDDIEISKQDDIDNPFSGGNGVEGNPYIITTADQMAFLAMSVNAGNKDYKDKYYKLGNDINLSAYGQNYNSNQGWIPIGTTSPFEGSFDGDGKKITGLYINGHSGTSNLQYYYAGLFGQMQDATIKNLGVVNVDITTAAGPYAGGLVGYATWWNDGSKISNCYTTGKVSAEFGGVSGAYVGGIAGSISLSNSNISNCYSTCNVTSVCNAYYNSNSAGGIVGSNSGTVLNCYSTGSVVTLSAHNDAHGGGIANGGTISNCAALNKNINCAGENNFYGRITSTFSGNLSNNIGYTGIINPIGTTWVPSGSYTLNGEDITLQDIKADGTLGGRFTEANGWTTQNGKLPGLFGKPVDMPAHLGGGVGIVETDNYPSLRIYPNPTNYELKITNYEGGEVQIYDLMGRTLMSLRTLEFPETTIDVSHLPSGMYFLKIGEKTARFVKE